MWWKSYCFPFLTLILSLVFESLVRENAIFFLFSRSLISCHIPFIILWIVFVFLVWRDAAFFHPLILSYPFHLFLTCVYLIYLSCMKECRIPPLISSQLGLISCHIPFIILSPVLASIIWIYAAFFLVVQCITFMSHEMDSSLYFYK